MNKNLKDLVKSLQRFQETFSKSKSEFYKLTNDPNNLKFIQNSLENISQDDFPFLINVDTCSKKFAAKFGNSFISYYTVFSNEFLNILIFILPKGFGIPEHDHPGMFVFSKNLFGEIAYKSWDILDVQNQIELQKLYFYENSLESQKHLLNICNEKTVILHKNDIVNLNPMIGNVHCFNSLENSAFLDVIFPDYDFSERFCNYYKQENDSKMKLINPPNIFMKEFSED